MLNEMTIKCVLLQQYELYPKMQIQDMVKLIYQNEFAGRHLIVSEISSLKRLQEEYRFLRRQHSSCSGADAAYEKIGNGLCRLHLEALKGAEISLKTVNRFFISTANSIRGSMQSFEEKLDVLRQCCKDRDLLFPLDELEAYLYDYKNQGYPQVRHSENYRAAYSPAYRIVRLEYCEYFEIFCRIDALLKSKKCVNVAIDGNCGAGKSTLALLINNIYDCNIFHMDDFFLRPELKTEERLKEVGGNVDYVRFQQEIITGMQSGCEFQYRTYDCRQMNWGKTITVVPKRLNIIEGAYSMHSTLIESYDLKIFLHINEKEQSMRILKREGADMQKRFLREWIPMENRYFKDKKIQEQSDLIFRCGASKA